MVKTGCHGCLVLQTLTIDLAVVVFGFFFGFFFGFRPEACVGTYRTIHCSLRRTTPASFASTSSAPCGPSARASGDPWSSEAKRST